jgi:MFS family permease
MVSPRSMLLPLVLAQFVASYACTNMNVAVTSIANDLNTTVQGVQTVITLFTLTMAALMIPGSKLSDIWGRRRCFRLGLLVYGIGALVSTFAPGLGVLVIGYSLLEGIGSALMIPPIYILVTVYTTTTAQRAKGLAAVSAAAGVGSAVGPLIGGFVTSAFSWRASFLLQALFIVVVMFLSRRIKDIPAAGPKPAFDMLGAVLTAGGLFFIVLGVLQSGVYGWFVSSKDVIIGNTVVIPEGGISPVWVLVAIGGVLLAAYFWYATRSEHSGHEPLISPRLFLNRTSDLGLTTQLVQWLTLQGSFFVISVYFQTVQKHSPIETGLMLTPTTIGILLASALAGRLARKRTQKLLIESGFVLSVGGTLVLLALSSFTSNYLASVPGLLIIGLGVGVMLTASANVVQSAFPESEQGEISGLSRSVSNLGSSLGTAIVGSVLVIATSNHTYALALLVMAAIGLVGLGAALLLPRAPASRESPSVTKPVAV